MKPVWNLRPEEIQKYTILINVTKDWLSSRDPKYPVNSPSKLANRYNRDGDTAYYLASGIATMQAEVAGWQQHKTYYVSPTMIHAFDLPSWSLDHNCHEEFLQSKELGGHGVCQQITDQLTGVYGLSGILYNSAPMHAAGRTGYCLVILPQSGHLVDDTFFVQDYGDQNQ